MITLRGLLSLLIMGVHLSESILKTSGDNLRERPENLNKKISLIIICIGFFMVSIDATVVNVALDSLQKNLHAGLSGLQWTVDAYTLAFAALLLSAGGLGDIFGAKKVFNIGLIIFTIASALCGLSATLVLLLFARVLQGIGAALLVSTSLALLQKIFSDPAERAKAFGVWGGVGGVAVAAGPVLGGILIHYFGWESVFYLNIPFGVAGIFLSLKFLPKIEAHNRGINIPSQILSILILGLITYMFINVASNGWHDERTKISLIALALTVILFIINENKSLDRILPKGIFSTKKFTAATIVGMIINFGFYGQLFILSLYFQQVKNYSTIETGLALLPQAIVCSLTAFYCGKVTAKTGARFPMLTGLISSAVGYFFLSYIKSDDSYILMLLPMLVIGFGMSFTAPATVSAGMSAALPGKAGIYSGVLNAARQSGSVMGIALLGGFTGSKYGFAVGMHQAFLLNALLFSIATLITFTSIKK